MKMSGRFVKTGAQTVGGTSQKAPQLTSLNIGLSPRRAAFTFSSGYGQFARWRVFGDFRPLFSPTRRCECALSGVHAIGEAHETHQMHENEFLVDQNWGLIWLTEE